LGVDLDIYDANGVKVATIRNGNIVDYNRVGYTAAKERHRYSLTEDATGRLICDVRKSGKAGDGSELEVSVDLYTKRGVHLVANSEGTKLGGIDFLGNTINGCEAGIVIP
jgi:hypothetical protein